MYSLNHQHFLQAIIGHWETIVRQSLGRDFDAQQFLRKAGIVRITQGHYHPIQVSQVHQLIDLTVNQLHIDGLGLRIAQRLKLQDMGAWGYAMINCQNIKQLLDTGLQFSFVTKDYVDIHIGYDSEWAYITIVDRSEGRSAQHYNVEESLCHYYLGLQQFLNERFDSELIEIDFAYSAPSYQALYREVFEHNLMFDRQQHQLRFPVDWIHHSISLQPSLIAHIATQQSQQFDGEQDAPLSYQIRIKLLSQLKYGLPSMETVADEMNMTSRTLRRRLETEGTTFKHLVLDTRMQVAKELLLSSELSTTEIADMLNYHSSPPFFRAFQGYVGVSPSQFRANNKSQ
ncbi:AraC family transcriptional regulator ligand-binding domain-containing protein [Vibrio maritimus]|uniref:AraC family transcriptional regulator ligand-binding domain-containing protein n=1 Tax=Vibrio maritimus TaxID=990268 RepID=UPI004067F32A